MSPEQTTGDGAIGPPSDLYALGHIAFALLVGKPYWMEEQESLPMYAFLGRIIQGPTEAPSARAARLGVSLPAGFDAWFQRSTAREPARRFDRATTQIAELATALGTPTPRQLLRAPPQLTTRLSTPAAPPASAPDVGRSSRSRIAQASTVLGTQTNTSGITSAVIDGRVPPSRTPRVVGLAIGLTGVLVGGLILVRQLGGAGASSASMDAPPALASAPPPAVSTTASTTPEPTVSVAPAGEPAASATAPASKVERLEGGPKNGPPLLPRRRPRPAPRSPPL